MFMVLPDGTKFRLLSPDKIPLNLAIRAQKATGIGPMALVARLGATEGRLQSLAPIWARVDAAADDAARTAALGELEAATADNDFDVLAYGVWVWLSRVAAGSPEMTLEEACDFSLLEAVTELEPEEQAALDRAAAEAEQVPPTTAAASRNGRASGKPSPRRRATSTST